jgi:hypothetical protein
VDALSDVSALTMAVVQKLACFICTFCFNAPFFHPCNVHRRVENFALGFLASMPQLPCLAPPHANQVTVGESRPIFVQNKSGN